MRKLVVSIMIVIMFIVGCGDDSTSYCDHGNRIYPDHGVAANDPSCAR